MRIHTIIAVTLAVAASAQAQSCWGELGHWTFDGNTLDSSGRANHGTPHGTIAYATGVAGSCLLLDGDTTFVSVANHPSLNPSPSISVSAWYRPVSFSGSGNDSLIDKGYVSHSSPYYQYHLGVGGDRYNSFGASFGWSVNEPGGTGVSRYWTAGTWYHLVGTYDGATERFYVDGQLRHSLARATPIPDYGRDVLFGKFNNLNFYLPGAIDEIRIFGRALADDEAALLHDSPDGSPLLDSAGISICNGGDSLLSVRALHDPSTTYQWRKDGSMLDGETGPTLSISHASGSTQGSYDCIVTTSCGSRTTPVATFQVCIGDFNCDGGVDGGDVQAFFAAWEAGDSAADVNEDGGIDGADVGAFFGHWEAGC